MSEMASFRTDQAGACSTLSHRSLPQLGGDQGKLHLMSGSRQLKIGSDLLTHRQAKPISAAAALGASCSTFGLGVEDGLLDVLRRAKPAVCLHHPSTHAVTQKANY